jgi:hypothetical protein
VVALLRLALRNTVCNIVLLVVVLLQFALVVALATLASNRNTSVARLLAKHEMAAVNNRYSDTQYRNRMAVARTTV